jgi:hypothetical protein
MKRRAFITLLGGVGGSMVVGFVERLHALGWSDGYGLAAVCPQSPIQNPKA